MRRTRLLAAAFAGGICLAALAPVAAAGPAAEVSPSRVPPGGTVTVSVSCGEAVSGEAPGRMRASSSAFATGAVTLTRAAGRGDDDSGTPGPTYRGEARVTTPTAVSGGSDTEDGPVRSSGEVTGSCPNGDHWRTHVTLVAGHGGGTPPVRAMPMESHPDNAVIACGGALLSAAAGYVLYVRRRRRFGE